MPFFELIVDDSSIDATALAAAATSPNRLIYQTAPLAAPIHISGIPSVSLRMAFNAPSAIVSSMLIEYRSNGTRSIITRGWADPQNRKSLWRDVRDSSRHVLRDRFRAAAARLRVPDRVAHRLMLLSTDRLFTLRPPKGAVLTLDTTKSTFSLPVVGGAAAFTAATN